MSLHRLLIFAVLFAALPASASASVIRGQALSPDGQDLYVIAQDGEEDGALSHYKVGAGGGTTYVGCYGILAGCGPSGFSEFDWPLDIERGRFVGQSARGQIGRGGRELKLETVNGNIEIRRAR